MNWVYPSLPDFCKNSSIVSRKMAYPLRLSFPTSVLTLGIILGLPTTLSHAVEAQPGQTTPLTDKSDDRSHPTYALIGRQLLQQTNNQEETIRSFSDGLTVSQKPQEATIFAFQTDQNSVRIYRRGEQTLMNVFNKQNRVTRLNGVPVTVEPSPQGTSYIYRGEATVQVFQANYGRFFLQIGNNPSEEDTPAQSSSPGRNQVCAVVRAMPAVGAKSGANRTNSLLNLMGVSREQVVSNLNKLKYDLGQLDADGLGWQYIFVYDNTDLPDVPENQLRTWLMSALQMACE